MVRSWSGKSVGLKNGSWGAGMCVAVVQKEARPHSPDEGLGSQEKREPMKGFKRK